MSAIAVTILGLGLLLVWSGITGQALFVGPNAKIPAVLKGQTTTT